MKDIFVHLDKLKNIYIERKGKSPDKNKLSNKSPFSNNSDKNSTNISKHSTNYFNTIYFDNNYNKSISIERPSIINLNKNIKKIDFSHKVYLIEEGSDSEDCINEDTKEVLPSLMKVAKNIFDPNKIMVLTDINYFPKEATPGLIISGIEDWVTDKHIKYFIQDVPTFIDFCKKNNSYNSYNHNYDDNYLSIISTKIFVEQKNRYAYVKLNSFSQMESIVSFFLSPIKKLYPSYNSKKEKIEVYYAYNILELTKNHWYGVILRNLPNNCNDKTLFNFTEQKVENGIKYCLNPINIDNLCCALVVCKELEYAEKLCFDLNNSEQNNKVIRAHLHPYTCKIRNWENYKNNESFSKNGYIFDKDAEESEKCIEYAKTFMEFFFPNYINTFFNSKNKKKEEENKIRNIDKNINSNGIKIKNSKDLEKEKEKNNKKKKDFTLASSIINLIKSKNNNKIIDPQKNTQLNQNNNNPNNNTESLNNNPNQVISNNNNKIIKNEIMDNNKKETIDIKNINNINNNNVINQVAQVEKGEIPQNNQIPKYSELDIKYYTYNMGDKNYYDEKEKEEKKNSYIKYKRINRDNNYNHSYNNYNNNYNNSFHNYNHNHNNYNPNYKKYDYKNNSPNYKYSSSSNYYKNYNKNDYRNKDKDKERGRDWDKDRNERNRDRFFSNDSHNKKLERSREKSIEDEKINKNKDKKYNNYEFDKRKERERYSNDRNNKYIDNKYNDIKSNDNKYNDNKYYNKYNNNKYNTDNKYYDRNNIKYYNNKYYERKKDSWDNKSKNRNDKDKRDN